jgi:hypothetical protein
MHRSGNSVSSSLLPMLRAHEEAAPESRMVAQETVPVQRLDRHPAVRAIDGDFFVKLDTQGYELHVLRGAEHVMDRIAGLMLEASLVPLYDGQPLLAEVIAFLERWNFTVVDLLPEFQHPKNGQMLQVDLIAVRNPS